jgi:group I intron endonuclease
MIVYKVTCLENNKIYIGKTIKSFAARKREHLCDARLRRYGSVFHTSIRKYGPEKFVWEVIDQCLFSESLIELEKYYIKKFDCMAPKGMNLTSGGDGTCGRKCSEETKNKIRIKQIGKKQSKSAREKMSIARKGKQCGKANPMFGMTGDKNPFYGKKHTEETKEKMRKPHVFKQHN